MSAKCYTCSKVLIGSWAMTGAGATGCYIGIQDGYFFYDGNHNWVYCYCHPCWQKRILTCNSPNVASLSNFQATKNSFNQYTQLSSDVAALQTRKTQIPQDITNKTQQKALLAQNINNLQVGKNSLTADITTLQQQLVQLQQINNQTTQEIDVLTTTKDELSKELSSLQQQQQNITKELDILEPYHATLKQQTQTIMNSTGFTQLEQIMTSLSDEEKKTLKDGGIDWSNINSGFNDQLIESAGKYLRESCNKFEKYPK